MEEIVLNSKKTALMVIDMQNDFCDKRGYHASIGKQLESIRKIIPNIQRLAKVFHASKSSVIYATQIYEPDGTDSPHKRHEILPQFARARYKSVIAVRGSWGAEIIDELKPNSDDFVVKKRRFSAFYNTDLETMLRCREIKTLVMTGGVTYVCVEHTVRDAFIRDFDVIVVSDAVAGWDDELHRNSLKSMAWSCALTATTEEVLEMLQRSQINIKH